MESYNVVFPSKERVVVQQEAVVPPQPDEVLCAAEVSMISIGTELTCLRGTFDLGTYWDEWVKYPFHPGYSMVGHVIEVGQNVSGLKVGDRVTAYATHQQYFTMPAQDCYPVPDSVTSEAATWRSLACTTQIAVRRAQLQLGETVGVIGLGILGQLVTQYLHLSGSRQIIAIDPIQSRLDAAHRHGSTHLLPMSVNDAVPAIREITGGRMLDVVFDVTGHPAVLAPATLLLHKLGRLILLGDTPTPSQQTLGPRVVSNALSILAVHGYAAPIVATEFSPWSIGAMSGLFFDYLAQGRMQVSDLITHRYSALDAADAYQQLQQDRSSAIGILLDWQGIG